MKNLIIFISSLMLFGCASTPNTKWNDKNMRVMIDPDSVDQKQYNKVLAAVMRLNKFTVVARGRGFKAVQREQERLHGEDTEHRYSDREKWAHWGELYGVGAIIVPTVNCRATQHAIGVHNYNSCEQFLRIVDANTGQILVMVEGENEADRMSMAPDWNEVAYNLHELYHEYDKELHYSEKLIAYQEASARSAAQYRQARKSRAAAKRAGDRDIRRERLQELLEDERIAEEFRGNKNRAPAVVK